MQNQMRTALLSAFLLSGIFSPCDLNAQTGRKEITLEDIWLKNTFRMKSVPGFSVMKSGGQYTIIDSGKYITSMSMIDGSGSQRLFSGNVPWGSGLAVEDYELSSDETQVMLKGGGRPLYRRSAFYRIAIHNRTTNRTELVDTGEVLHATFSPDGSKVAFVRDNNLYYRDLRGGRTVAVTTDGKWNHIINGNCDWVYEEEFEFTRAFQWSPDSRFLAYYRFDESAVPEFSFPKYTGLYPQNYSYKYPKAGEANSVVTIHFYDLGTGKKTTAQTAKDGNTDYYIPRIMWMADPQKLCIFKLNRLQNQLQFLAADRSTGAVETLFTEKDEAFVEISDNYFFLPDRHSMIYTSERGGFMQVCRADWKARTITPLSQEGVDVESILRIDTLSRKVYYSAAPDAIDRKLCVVSWKGGKPRVLTPEAGTHSITPAGVSYFLDRFSTLTAPPVYRLIDTNGKVVRMLESNTDLQKKMGEYALGSMRFLQLPSAAGGDLRKKSEMLNAWMITPPDFDSSRKYPVLMYQYSGPGSQEVGNRFPVRDFFWHHMLAQKGYIVVCVDGRGTGYRGRDFKKSTYLQLGKLESEDQIAAARFLQKQNYVDANRIGIWGWSYGGFMSSTCLFKAPDVFKAAISVAPVTNWRFYDNIYTERYMRTPQENAEGYDRNSPLNMVKGMKGKLLLVHGTADDNVHFQNSVELVDELVKAGKQFDFQMYPDKAHGISGAQTRYQLYQRMTDFILQNL